jgi:hypothetical protein
MEPGWSRSVSIALSYSPVRGCGNRIKRIGDACSLRVRDNESSTSGGAFASESSLIDLFRLTHRAVKFRHEWPLLVKVNVTLVTNAIRP